MARYITVDGGTTNTRLTLIDDGKVLSVKKTAVGARNGREALISAIKEAADEIAPDLIGIEAVIASGMITSEYGLVNLPHVTAPAGIPELHESMHKTEFPEIGKAPWYFIRGVKTAPVSLDKADVMRGEETELMGILEGEANSLYIMPGSHSKHIKVDKNGKITDFSTMMSGELFAAVMQNTILRDAADFEHSALIEERLLEGYEYTDTHGINEALFKVRILKNIFGAAKEECYSFLLGVTLHAEVKSILESDAESVIITGQKQQKEAIACLLSRSGKTVTVLNDERTAASTALGAVKIYEYGKG